MTELVAPFVPVHGSWTFLPDMNCLLYQLSHTYDPGRLQEKTSHPIFSCTPIFRHGLSVSLCLSVFPSVCLSLCGCVYICVRLSLCGCICVRLRACVCVALLTLSSLSQCLLTSHASQLNDKQARSVTPSRPLLSHRPRDTWSFSVAVCMCFSHSLLSRSWFKALTIILLLLLSKQNILSSTVMFVILVIYYLCSLGFICTSSLSLLAIA